MDIPSNRDFISLASVSVNIFSNSTPQSYVGYKCLTSGFEFTFELLVNNYEVSSSFFVADALLI
jgi:hypothetical protein